MRASTLNQQNAIRRAASMRGINIDLDVDDLDFDAASSYIGALKSMPFPDEVPEVVAQATTQGVADRPGMCALCQHPTAPGEAYWFGPHHDGGPRFKVAHKVGGCSTEPVEAPAPLPEPKQTVRASDGRIVKVVRSQAGRLYGKVLTGVGAGNRLDWTYDGGVIALCHGAPVVSDDEVRAEAARIEWGTADPVALAEIAKAHAEDHHACMFCGLELTDDPSVAAGYGPVCAEKYGLPWG